MENVQSVDKVNFVKLGGAKLAQSQQDSFMAMMQSSPKEASLHKINLSSKQPQQNLQAHKKEMPQDSKKAQLSQPISIEGRDHRSSSVHKVDYTSCQERESLQSEKEKASNSLSKSPVEQLMFDFDDDIMPGNPRDYSESDESLFIVSPSKEKSMIDPKERTDSLSLKDPVQEEQGEEHPLIVRKESKPQIVNELRQSHKDLTRIQDPEAIKIQKKEELEEIALSVSVSYPDSSPLSKSAPLSIKAPRLSFEEPQQAFSSDQLPAMTAFAGTPEADSSFEELYTGQNNIREKEGPDLVSSPKSDLSKGVEKTDSLQTTSDDRNSNKAIDFAQEKVMPQFEDESVQLRSQESQSDFVKEQSNLAQNIGQTSSKETKQTTQDFLQKLDFSSKKTDGQISQKSQSVSTQKFKEQIELDVKHAVMQKQNRFTINLKPPELGSVKVNLDFMSDGGVKARFTLDNHETYKALKSNPQMIENIFKELDLKVANSQLEFQYSGDRGEQFQNSQNFGEGRQDGDNRSALEHEHGESQTAVEKLLEAEIISDEQVNIKI